MTAVADTANDERTREDTGDAAAAVAVSRHISRATT